MHELGIGGVELGDDRVRRLPLGQRDRVRAQPPPDLLGVRLRVELGAPRELADAEALHRGVGPGDEELSAIGQRHLLLVEEHRRQGHPRQGGEHRVRLPRRGGVQIVDADLRARSPGDRRIRGRGEQLPAEADVEARELAVG